MEESDNPVNNTPDEVYEEIDEIRNGDLARVPKGIEYALENGILRVNAGLDGKVTARATVYTTAPEEEIEYKYNHEGLRIQKRHKKRSGEEYQEPAGRYSGNC